MKHGIVIPAEERDEMVSFLTAGLQDAQPPAWITWAVDADADNIDAPNDDHATSSSSESDDDGDGDECLPFLHLPLNPDGRKCRCGSDTHLTVNSFACPLNARNRVDDDDDNAAPADAAPADDAHADDAHADDTTPDEDAHADDTTPDEDLDDDTPDEAAPDAPVCRGRRRRDDTTVAAPPARRRKTNFLKKNADVEVLYEDKWWPARIVFKHRGDAGYAIHYHDEDGCEEQNVEENRIRPIQE